MLDPYRMVFVNLIASLLVCGGIVFYKNIFPKRKINLFVVLLLLSALLSISIFRKGVYESGDFTIHIYRNMSFYDSLKEGHFLPSWAAGLNATYGYPLFIFNYPLPYYVISFFYFLGFTFITSMKLFLAVNIVLSGIFMYFFMKSLFNNTTAAFTASVFYLFAPYHLIDVHFKIVIGEILFFTLLPLTFFFINKVSTRKLFPIVIAGICFALLIMSHVAIALFAALLFLAYSIFTTIITKRSIKGTLISTTISLVIGSILSFYIWVTPFLLGKYTIFKEMQSDRVFSVPFHELLFAPWRMGFLFQGPQGEISNLIGYSQLFVVLILFFLVLRRKIASKYRNRVFFWLGMFIALVFLITSLSDPFWKLIPFIRNVGNHRLLILVAFTTSVLAGYLSLIFINKLKFVYLLIILTIASTILNWGHRGVFPNITDSFLRAGLWKSTSSGEGHFYANSKWIDKDHPWFSTLPASHLTILKGSGKIKELTRTSTKHTYVVSAETPLSLQENTLFFPGWKVFVNEKKSPIEYEKTALMQFSIPKGASYIRVTYSDVPPYKLLKQISVAGFLISTSYVLYVSLKKLRTKFRHSQRFSRKN